MRVLVVNCGSSTLKFQLIDTAKEDAAPAAERYLARGVIERIGSQAALDFQAGCNAYQDTATIADHEEASRRVLAWLDTAGFLAPSGLDAVGHRVVHGGPHFVAPTRLDDERWKAFSRLLHYVSGEFHEEHCMSHLFEELQHLDTDLGLEGRRLFYCATPPSATGGPCTSRV